MKKVYDTPQMEVVSFAANKAMASNGEVDYPVGGITPGGGLS